MLTEPKENSIKEKQQEGIRCYWCHTTEGPERDFEKFQVEQREAKEEKLFYACSPEHKGRIRKFFQFANKFYWLFLVFTIIFPLILLILTLFYFSFVFIFGLFMSIGLGIMILPLLGNQLPQNLGLRKANLIGRLLGAMLFTIGITLIIINGLQIFR